MAEISRKDELGKLGKLNVIKQNIYTVEEDISGDERWTVERRLDVYSGAG